jgi:GMP synthase (glutamine-hydrolysing)
MISASPQTQSLNPDEFEVSPTAPRIDRQMIAILDFGSQYSELIARRIRETQVYSEVLSYRTSIEHLRSLNPKGIILSGGPSSVYDKGAPLCDPELWNLGIPVLGVCYGMQLMVQQLGGVVEQADLGEYGKASLLIDDPTDLLTNVDQGTTMWMSHGDSVTQLPDGFKILAHTANTPCAAIAHHDCSFYRGAVADSKFRLSHLWL